MMHPQPIAGTLGPVAQALDNIRNLSGTPQTWATYSRGARRFVWWLTDRGRTAETCDHNDCVAYLGFLRSVTSARGKPYAAASVNHFVVSARVLLAELVAMGVRPDNPANRLPMEPLAEFSSTPYLAFGEARALLDLLESKAADSLRAKRDLAYFNLAIRTGLRRSELRWMDAEHLGREGEHDILRFVAKGGYERRIPLRANVLRPLRAWLDAAGIESGPVWRAVWGRRGGEGITDGRLSAQAMERSLHRWCKLAGIGHHMTLHGLRATFATLSLAGGASLYLVQRSMGHKDPRTTERYDKRRQSLDEHAGDFLHL